MNDSIANTIRISKDEIISKLLELIGNQKLVTDNGSVKPIQNFVDYLDTETKNKWYCPNHCNSVKFAPLYTRFSKNGKRYQKSIGDFLRTHNFSFTAHDIRATRITHLIDSGMELRLITELVGHMDVKTTLTNYYKATTKKRLDDIAKQINGK